MSRSPTSLEQIRALYLDTDYLVLDGKRRLTARVGRLNPEIDALLERRGAAEAVFVTAWNPRSQPRSQADNDAAHARLLEILEDEDLEFLPHEGRARGGDWAEQGVLIFDLPPLDALALAEHLQQNAIVWQALGQPAQLLFTRLAVA
ncbi:DUF3293 domain-containing protein [Oleisolibacter albus]|uniref:DUF3293 domain-containing protein n=1 Tax=Oleisolibacter albus TaxID=2171757 RepID=UPI000DF2358D|nr:DUF3293 domain-containing protein [Oleisolibacter albus]